VRAKRRKGASFLGLGLGLGLVFGVSLALALGAAVAAPRALADEPGGRNGALAAAFRDAAASVTPSVVAVYSAGGGDALGYAVAVEDGGVLLTSTTVAEAVKGEVATVRGADGFEASASVRGRAEAYGVVLLEIRGGGKRPALAYGDVAKLEVGQFLVSVGADRREPVLAVGIVSAKDRRVEAREGAPTIDIFGLFDDSEGPKRSFARVIQHDSPIAPEHHGSPVVDAGGKLIGVNVASVYRGTVYAAPIDELRSIVADLRAGKDGPSAPKPAYLGVAVGPVPDERRKELGLAADAPGVSVGQIVAGAAADKAGLRTGDVIVKVSGREIRSADELGETIRSHAPGAKVEIVVRRGAGEEAEEITVVAALGERP